MNGWPMNGGEAAREKGGRGKAILPVPLYRSISSWKSPHLLRALLHSSPIVSGKNPFSVCALAARACICVCESVCEESQKQ